MTDLDDYWAVQVPALLDSLSGMTCTHQRITPGAMGGDGTPVTEVTTTTAGVRCTPLYDVIDAGDNSYTAKMFLNISSVMQADLITINGGLWTVTKAKAIQTGTNTPGYLLELHARGRVAP